LGNGTTVTFWEDLWCGEILAHKFPRLFSFARNAAISVQDFAQADDLDTLFALPLSIEAHEELLQLDVLLLSVELNPVAHGSWSFAWGNQNYTSRRYYRMVFENF
jgi:hypothetical protein